MVFSKEPRDFTVRIRYFAFLGINHITRSQYRESALQDALHLVSLRVSAACTSVAGFTSLLRIDAFRSESDGRGGYSWSITFLEYVGDVPMLVADNDLTGYAATVSVSEVGRRIREAIFRVGLEIQTFDCTKEANLLTRRTKTFSCAFGSNHPLLLSGAVFEQGQSFTKCAPHAHL